MTRKRKSRKSGVGSIGASKTDKKLLSEVSDKKPKKQTGNKAGTRQTIATAKNKQTGQGNKNNDPRLGSKKPIVLIQASEKRQAKIAKKKILQSSVAPIKVLEPDTSLEQELQAIEQDEQLQLILTKQDSEQALTEQEVAHFNKLMERHQEITEQLGLDEEEQQDEPTDLSEDDLWDKLDSSDFSKFE